MTDHKHFSLIESVRKSRKYRLIDLPDDMLFDILEKESIDHKTYNQLEASFRRKLHNIVAQYLEDINYANEIINIQKICFNQTSEINDYCRGILSKHASTRERLPYIDELYPRLFEITGSPKSILDLACGLHPFSIPWMRLDPSVLYYAYDIHKPRVEFLNLLLKLLKHQELALQQDILLNPPRMKADIAFFFKEAHRFEKRRPGCNLEFWKTLNVNWLIISLPSMDLKRHHNLEDKHQTLVQNSIPENYFQYHKLIIGDEIFYLLKNNYEK